jgi:hypothetical protein
MLTTVPTLAALVDLGAEVEAAVAQVAIGNQMRSKTQIQTL